MSSRDPLGPHATAATEAAQRLQRAIAEADWTDGARRDFNRRHLERIRADANGLAAGMQTLAERCRTAATRIGNDN